MTTVLGRLRDVEESLKADPLPDDEYVAIRVDHHRALLALCEACIAMEEFLSRGHDASVDDRVRYAKEEDERNRQYSAALTALTALTEGQP